jgi:hypothetical protein
MDRLCINSFEHFKDSNVRVLLSNALRFPKEHFFKRFLGFVPLSFRKEQLEEDEFGALGV